MSSPYIGQITLFGGTFAPQGWALCNGQILSIAQNAALFSILGTTYGGDGQSTFGLPDLRGRVAIHAGQGPGLTNRTLGSSGGTENVTLTTAQIPSHEHTLRGRNEAADSDDPTNNVPAIAEDQNRNGLPVYSTAAPNADMDADAITPTGGGGSHPNVQPYLTVNYIIALTGVFPSP